MVATARIAEPPPRTEVVTSVEGAVSIRALSAWETVQLARHPNRPHALDYIRHLCSEFVELRGDRRYADDPAIIGGIGRTPLGSVVVVGHQKGSNMRENIRHNFGMPFPDGYRKALRLMEHAEKFGMPLICLLDTPGAQPSMEAEQRGQAEAIARNLMAMTRLRAPIVAAVIGEGGSGGALALGLADRLLMLENAVYSVASPEAAATILWSDASRAPEAAAAMRVTAGDLFGLGVADDIVPEPVGGAHSDPEAAVSAACGAILQHLADIRCLDPDLLLSRRYARYRAMGDFYQVQDVKGFLMERASTVAARAEEVRLSQLKEVVWQSIDEQERETLDVDTITTETELADLPLDSLATIEMLYGLEKTFEVAMPEEDVFAFRTVGDVLDYIRNQVAAKARRTGG